MEKEVLSQEKVLSYILKKKSVTSIIEAKNCYDRINSTIRDLKLENVYINELNVDIDEIMSYVMKRKTPFILGMDGETIYLKKNVKATNSNLPNILKEVVKDELFNKDTAYQKRLV